MAADAWIQVAPNGAANWPYEPQRSRDTTVLAGVSTSLTGAPFTYIPAPDGTVVTFTILSGPGTLSNVTTTVGGTARVNLTNTGTGTTVLRASVAITVGGTPLTRHTGDGLSSDSLDFTATWVNVQARITFTGRSAPTQVGVPGQTFPMQATVEVNNGAGWQLAPNGTVINMSLAGGVGSVGSIVGGVNTCTTGDNTAIPPNTGSCALLSVADGGVTSSIAGVDQVRAGAFVIVNGVTLTPTTNDGFQGDSLDAHVFWGAAPVMRTRWATGGYASNG